MAKRVLGVLIFVVLFLFVGCGDQKTASQKTAPQQTTTQPTTGQIQKDDSAITVAYIAMVQASPQALINRKYPIFNEQLQKIGRQVRFVSTRSLDNIWPMMDKDTGDPDFVYIPSANFSTYITETSRFGGSNKYAIIAGSSNSNSTVLFVKPGINSLKELAGKKIGVANLRYSDEFQFNKLLNGVGLSTNSVGGTVQMAWDDIVPKQLENWGKGEYDGILLYAPENFAFALGKVPGSKILTTLNPNGTFGKYQPRVWLAAKKELIKNDPQLVKEVLKAHLLSTDKALAEFAQIPALNREVYLGYYKEKNAEMTEILKKHTLEFYQKKWNETEITYDPNIKYVTDVFGFMEKRGLTRGKTLKDFVQVDLLNEVLKQLNKPAVK